MKIRLANQLVTLHWFKDQTMVFQAALNLALQDKTGDLMIKLALLSVTLQESSLFKTVSTFVLLLAHLDNTSNLKTTNATLHALVSGNHTLKTVFVSARDHAH